MNKVTTIRVLRDTRDRLMKFKIKCKAKNLTDVIEHLLKVQRDYNRNVQ